MELLGMENYEDYQNHQERMEYLKNHDPMTFYEMTTDPCGSENDNVELIGTLIFIFFVIAILIVIAIL